MSSTAPSILAIDLGTSDIKAGVVTADGRLVALAREPHVMQVDAATGCAEQDPEQWWSGLRTAMASLRGALETPPSAICCVGQGPTLVVTDDAGDPVRPAITWMDRRPSAVVGELEATVGLSGWGLGILPAARWYELDAAGSAGATGATGGRWYLNSWEWLSLRMAGVAVATHTPGQLLPDRERAARAGLAAGRLPPVVEAGSVLGSLTQRAARELGLPVGTPVVAGTNDAFAAFHGAGLLDPGDAVDTGGTSGGLAVYTDHPVTVPGAWVAAAPLPERWIVGGAMSSTGRALSWLATEVLGGAASADGLIAEAAAVPPGADGLLFLPYLAGERSPLWDPLARGAFVGLTLAHGRAHLARAVLEAAALALRHVAEPIVAAGIEIRELRMTGGTARGEGWNQIKADVLGVPVGIPAIRETAIAGAAILGATAIGRFANLREAVGTVVRIDHRLTPDPGTRPVYDALYAAYVALWPRIAPIVHDLQRLPR